MTDPTSEHPVVLFDGVCNLCNGFIQFLIERDEKQLLRFAPLQSEAGEKLRERYGVPSDVDSIVLVTADDYYVKSGAVLRILHYLSFPWSLSPVFLIVPRFIRDVVYGWVASNRYDWFGRKDVCMTPTEDIKNRFLDTDT